MPSTVNGIGTHYYGKKNVQKRPGPCPHCGRAVELTSHDTRLWFVVFFIPIFPLGRKRIIDYCSACTRHYAMEADKWETAKQLEVSGAMEKYRAHATPEDAMAAHQQLLNFHQFEQAAEFRKTMREKYADNAKVQAYLGGALEHFGKLDEANEYYARALELRSDLPEALVGVAQGHLRAGRFDEARKLLDFLEKPGAAQLYSLQPLDMLARAYQNGGRHEDALALFAILQRELPKLAEEKWFRTLVAKSEKVAGHRESQLPKLKFSWKRLFSAQPAFAGGPQITWRGLLQLGIILGLALAGFLVSNEYIRRHRTLHIVNGYPQPAKIKIIGVTELNNIRSHEEVSLPEGRYHVVINGPVKEEVDFEVRTGYFSRWFDDSVWVLNVGGSALLELERAVYAANDPPPVESTFAFGQPFHHFTGVTHPFQELPQSVQLKSGERRTLTSLSLFRNEPAALFYYLAQHRGLPEALRFAEWRLRLQPNDDALLTLYCASAQKGGQTDRVEQLLRPGLTNRPVLVQWHRYYQNLRRDRDHEARLAAEYDAQLRAEPTNSLLMYLRGRVANGREESRIWFQRACDADTNNAFAFYARGYDRMAVGDWAGARPLFAHACELKPNLAEFSEQLSLARFALRENAALEQELREQITRENLNYRAASRLCDVLVAQGRSADATHTARIFQAAAAQRSRTETVAPNRELHRHVLYATGDFATLEKECAAAKDTDANYTRFVALIELGRAEEAIKLLPLETKEFNNPFHFLDAAIALRAAGNAGESARWLARGLEFMDKGDADMARAAAALRKTTPPTMAELDDIALPVEAKATVVAALAQMHPARRPEFAALARKLNIVPGYPHHLIERSMAEAK